MLFKCGQPLIFEPCFASFDHCVIVEIIIAIISTSLNKSICLHLDRPGLITPADFTCHDKQIGDKKNLIFAHKNRTVFISYS